MKATNEREYSTAIREIDATKKTISTLETEVLKFMEQIEKLEVQVKERAPQIETSRNELNRQLALLNAEAVTDQEKLAAAQAERQTHFDALGLQVPYQ